MPDDLIELSAIRCRVRGMERNYAMLTHQEMTGRYVQFFLDYTYELPQVDTFWIEWAEGRKEVYSVVFSKGTVLEVNPSIPECMQGEIYDVNNGECIPDLLSRNFLKLTGSMVWNAEMGGNFIEIGLRKPLDINNIDEIQLYLRGRVYNNRNIIWGDTINVLLNYENGISPIDIITVQWTPDRIENYYVELDSVNLQPNPNLTDGWIRRDLKNTGGNECTVNISEKEICFSEAIQYSYSLGGHYIGVVIHAPRHIIHIPEHTYPPVRTYMYEEPPVVVTPGDPPIVPPDDPPVVPPDDPPVDPPDDPPVDPPDDPPVDPPDDPPVDPPDDPPVDIIDIPDLNLLEFHVRGEVFTCEILSEAEKRGKYIHLMLCYTNFTPQTEEIIVKWNRDIPVEETYKIVLENVNLIPYDEWNRLLLAQKITGLFVKNISHFDTFISDLNGRNNYLEPANIDYLKLCFQISRVVRNYIPMIEKVCESYFTDLITKGIRYIATYTLNSWKLLVNNEGVGFPDDFPNGEAYATYIYKTAQDLYTDISTITQLKDNSDFAAAAVILETKLFENPEFDLLTDRIEDLGIIPDEHLKEIKIIQNIYRACPDSDIACTMVTSGFANSEQIYRKGKRQLQEDLKASYKQEDIDSAYNMATARYANSLIAFTNINIACNQINPAGIAQYDNTKIGEDLINDFPNINLLFGNSDYCECKHDVSVYSAAAYLADLLAYLDSRKAKSSSSESVLSYLNYRRPDISKIYLTTQNTNTLMPYIDLVCEVLEEATLKVQNNDFQRTVEECQSTLTTQELCAAPEHLLICNNSTAYDILSESMYPMYAPLNLWEMEIRDYLKHIGIQRWDLMKKFQTETENKLPANVDIAAEYFSLSFTEQKIVTTNINIDIRNQAWNLSFTKNEVNCYLNSFLKDTGLTAYEALDLINNAREESNVDVTKLRWTGLIWSDWKDDCSSQNKIIKGTKIHYDRAHRFIRLWRKSGWKMWELDLLLRNNIVSNFVDFETDNLNETTLFKLMQFKQQQETLGLSVDALLAFYGNINILNLRENTKLQTCLYDRVFLRKALSNPLNANLQSIKDDTVSLNTEDKYLIAACLSVSDNDFNILFNAYSTELSDDCDLTKISYLYRLSVLMKKLKLTAEELFKVLEMKNITANSIFNLDDVDIIIETVNKIKKSKLSIFEYEYLVNYYYDIPSTQISEKAKGFALTDSQLEKYSDELNSIVTSDLLLLFPEESDIQGTAPDFTATDKYKNEFIHKLLAIDKGKYEDVVSELIQIIECTTNKSDIEIQGFINNLFPVVYEIAFSGNLNKIVFEYYEQLIDRYRRVILYINAIYSIINIENYISETFNLSSAISELYLTHSRTNNTNILRVFVDITKYYYLKSFIYPELELINKMSLITKRNNFTVEELIVLLSIQTKIGFDWYNFRTIENPENYISMIDIHKMQDMLFLHRGFGSYIFGNEILTLFSIIDKETLTSDDFYKKLCLLTGWNTSDFSDLQVIFEFTLNDFYSPYIYERISNCMQIKNSANTSIVSINEWKIRSEKETTKSDEVKGVVKAKYDINTWLDKLPEIQKPIREAKSNALSSFLIAYSLRQSNPLWKDKEDLYAYFLLDTEMSACMKTSRIVQATSSVQLFVQRCLLNLENPNVIVEVEKDDGWKQWDWMKKYRLWEANRKVFLYPENWIEPELRDDKTILFKEMEDELNQGEINNENVETAFENYLQKLHDISNLEVCGIYHEKVEDNDGFIVSDSTVQNTTKVSISHVIARTKTTPNNYYYRKYDLLNTQWSEWGKVEIDTKDSPVVPIVYNRRLHLFWLTVVEKVYNNNKKNNDKNEPDEFTEIRLCWTVLKNKKWIGTQKSQKCIIVKGHYPMSSYSLGIQTDSNNELKINVYYGCNSSVFINGKGDIEHLGIFFFNGDVYRNVMFDDSLIDSFSCQPITVTVNSEGVFSMNLYYTDDSSNILTDFPESKEDIVSLFEKFTNKLEKENIPELFGKKMNFRTWIFIPNSVFNSSRIYANIRNAEGCLEMYLPNLFNANKLIQTNKNNPNFVTMIHSNKPLQFNLIENFNIYPFFYQDSERSFFVQPFSGSSAQFKNIPYIYSFKPFYHPYTRLFIKELNRIGIPGLLSRNLQLDARNYYPKNTYRFWEEYKPGLAPVTIPSFYEYDIVDFDLSGTYSIYNWELFFHAPLYLACKLSQNQKFEEAMKWFHYIFNPTTQETGESPQKYWIPKPLYEISSTKNREQQITNILTNIESHAAEVNAWLNDPYKPHLIARTRPIAYQRTVVMKYIDNLIAWADQLFRQDTMESNNEATLLYILAYEILGKRPIMFPEKEGLNSAVNYNEIKNQYSKESYKWFLDIYDSSIKYTVEDNLNTNCIADYKVNKDMLYNDSFETMTSSHSNKNPEENAHRERMKIAQKRLLTVAAPTSAISQPLPRIDVDNFCIPANEQLLSYWDLVEDRLYKLRNCMNIEGKIRELALFEPPIDPALLVKAAAAGLSISDVLNDMTSPQPYYRFKIIMQKAVEFTNEVKQLGDKMLSALEKRDAETLNLLRSSQEINMQEAIRQVKKMQIEEATQNIANINESIKIAQAKFDYYSSRELMNTFEDAAYNKNKQSINLNIAATIGRNIASGLAFIPTFSIGGAGVAGSPYANAEFGGSQLAQAVNSNMNSLSESAQIIEKEAAQLLAMSGYFRRQEDWLFQATLAKKEIEQLNVQLVAAEIRLAIAEKELENTEMQIEQSKSVQDYYKSKYTNEALYNWMITQVSNVYFSAYKLAYDMAKKAEKCYRNELGIFDESAESFIQFGYWDSLKRGLMSGEKLIHSLQKLDAAYLNGNKRDLEMTKHISLAQMYPEKLLELISQTKTALNIEEFIFDMDYPGHYRRRIKSVSVTIPNVAGPYTNVSFMLSLQSAKIRKNSLLTDGVYDEDVDDLRFIYQTGGSQSICTSSAQNDSGMFELNFNDERYLPFENAGVISSWELSLPAGCNQFDLSSISDVILHINYTARYDGVLEQAARSALVNKLPTAGRMFFSLKQDFPDAWNQMDDNKSMTVMFETKHLPFFFRGSSANMRISEIEIVFTSKEEINPNGKSIVFKGCSLSLNNTTVRQYGDMYLYSAGIKLESNYPLCLGDCTINFSNSGISDMDNVCDVICGLVLLQE